MVFSVLLGSQKNTEKQIAIFSDKLQLAFSKIKNDMDSIHKQLANYQSELSVMSQWIQYLNSSHKDVSQAHSKLLQKQTKIEENHLNLHTSHKQLSNNHKKLLESHEKTAKIATEAAKTLENRQDSISNALLAHKLDIVDEFDTKLHTHSKKHEKALDDLRSWIDYFSTYIDQQARTHESIKSDIKENNRNWQESYLKLKNYVQESQTDLESTKNMLKLVKNDVNSTKSEVKTLIDDFSSATTKQELDNVRAELNSALENNISSVKNQFESSMSDLKQSIASMESKVASTANSAGSLASSKVSSVQTPTPQMKESMQTIAPVTTNFQRHIMSRVLPNRKGYVLKFLLDLIKENRYSTKELEEIAVNEKQLCGRTSFYAYLKELKLKGRISYAEIDERTILVNTDAQQRLE